MVFLLFVLKLQIANSQSYPVQISSGGPLGACNANSFFEPSSSALAKRDPSRGSRGNPRGVYPCPLSSLVASDARFNPCQSKYLIQL